MINPPGLVKTQKLQSTKGNYSYIRNTVSGNVFAYNTTEYPNWKNLGYDTIFECYVVEDENIKLQQSLEAKRGNFVELVYEDSAVRI